MKHAQKKLLAVCLKSLASGGERKKREPVAKPFALPEKAKQKKTNKQTTTTLSALHADVKNKNNKKCQKC